MTRAAATTVLAALTLALLAAALPAHAASLRILALNLSIEPPRGWTLAEDAGERGCAFQTPDGARVEIVVWQPEKPQEGALDAHRVAWEHGVLLQRSCGFRSERESRAPAPFGGEGVVVSGRATVDGEDWLGAYLAFLLDDGRACVIGGFSPAGQATPPAETIFALVEALHAGARAPGSVLVTRPEGRPGGTPGPTAPPAPAGAAALAATRSEVGGPVWDSLRQMAVAALGPALAGAAARPRGSSLAATLASTSPAVSGLASGAGLAPALSSEAPGVLMLAALPLRSGPPGLRGPAAAAIGAARPRVLAIIADRAQAFASGVIAALGPLRESRAAYPVIGAGVFLASAAPLPQSRSEEAPAPLAASAPAAPRWAASRPSALPRPTMAETRVAWAPSATCAAAPVAPVAQAPASGYLSSAADRGRRPAGPVPATATGPPAAPPSEAATRPAVVAAGAGAAAAAALGSSPGASVSRPLTSMASRSTPAAAVTSAASASQAATASSQARAAPATAPRQPTGRPLSGLPHEAGPAVGWAADAAGAVRVPTPVGWRVTVKVSAGPAGSAIEVQGVCAADPSARFSWLQPALPRYRDLTQLLTAMGYGEWQTYRDNATGESLTVARRRPARRFLEDVVLPGAWGFQTWQVLGAQPSASAGGLLGAGDGVVAHVVGSGDRGSAEAWLSLATGTPAGQSAQTWVGAWLAAVARPGDGKALQALLQAVSGAAATPAAGEAIAGLVAAAQQAARDLKRSAVP